MSLDERHILSVLGWGDGIQIPTANEENKLLEQQLRDLLKAKSDAMINLCIQNEKVNFTKKSLVALNKQRDENQGILNGMSKRLNSEMNSLKELEISQEHQSVDMKSLRKRIQEMENTIENHKSAIRERTDRMTALKESLCWGEEALWDWTQSLASGEQDLRTLAGVTATNQLQYQELEKEKAAVEGELQEAESLERREEERFKILALQLENVHKLIREALKDQERLMSVWQEANNCRNQRETENQQLSQILCEVKNRAREKCSELYEAERFHEDFSQTNERLRSEIEGERVASRKAKEELTGVQEEMKSIQQELDLRRKTVGNISGQIEMNRMRNSEMEAKNEVRKTKLEKEERLGVRLKAETTALNMDSQTNETTLKNADAIYEMRQKQMEEETKELERLNTTLVDLQREINKIKDMVQLKTKEIEIAKKLAKDIQVDLLRKEEELEQIERTLHHLREEEVTLAGKVTELREASTGEKEREELETELRSLEGVEAALVKEHLQLRRRLDCLQREYREKLRKLESAEEELDKLKERSSRKEKEYEGVRREAVRLQEEAGKAGSQLKLMKMKENYLREGISREDSALGCLHQRRGLLQTVMKNRLVEVETQKDILLAKKRTLSEEKMILTKQIDHVSSQIKLNQSRYASTLDLMGRDDSGQRLSVAYFKIKLAQEKYELQILRDELEAKISKADYEILAMDKTLKWFKATNENFKFGQEMVEENDAIKIEKERAETRYAKLKYEFEEETQILESLKNEIELLWAEIVYLKNSEEDLMRDTKVKDYEMGVIQRDLRSKFERLQRATHNLRKCLRAVAWAKEPPKYKQLALREINKKIEEERIGSAMRQLGKLSPQSPKVEMFLEKHSGGGKRGSQTNLNRTTQQSTSSQTARPDKTKRGWVEADGSSSSRGSTGSQVSIVNLDPAQLFASLQQTCLKKK